MDEPDPRHWQKLGLAASFPNLCEDPYSIGLEC